MKTPVSARRRERGLSVVELMVAVVIGLVVTLAVSGVLVRGEGRNRANMAANDINQTGAYAAHLLDSVARSAGSGFAHRWSETVGCRINARRDSNTILPRATAWPAPFAGFTQNVRVAPIIIGQGQAASGSDVIAVMRGNAGTGELPLEVLALGPPLGLRNTLGIADDELLLIADGEPECLLLQAGTTTADTVALAGTGRFHTVTGANRDLADFGTPTQSTVVVGLGNAGPSTGQPLNPPQFMLYGVGANRTLFALDLLGIDGADPQPIAEGVVELRGLYGIDNTGDGRLDAWVDPGVAPFDSASLLAGTPAAQQNLTRIVAVRIGLILRTARAEREDVSPETLTLFGDLGTALQRTRTLSADDKRFRHRTVEVTVPLRNVLLARTP